LKQEKFSRFVSYGGLNCCEDGDGAVSVENENENPNKNSKAYTPYIYFGDGTIRKYMS